MIATSAVGFECISFDNLYQNTWLLFGFRVVPSTDALMVPDLEHAQF